MQLQIKFLILDMELDLILVHFLFPSFDWGKNVIIFGVDNSSSVHTDNKKKYLMATVC